MLERTTNTMHGTTIACTFALALLAVPALGYGAGCGSTKLTIPGYMPNNGRVIEYSNITGSSSGIGVRSSFDLYPPTLSMNGCGAQQFRFEFSANVSRIRISAGSLTIYQGPPVPSITTPEPVTGDIDVEFAWTGKDVTVEIASQ